MSRSDKYKVVAVVSFGSRDDEALVLDKAPRITFERSGDYLFGIDEHGVFTYSYEYTGPTPFTGRHPEIPMRDGTALLTPGEWWPGGWEQHPESPMVNVGVAILDDLHRNYVFRLRAASAKGYEKLRKTYKGEVYGFEEYAETIRKNKV